MGSTLTHLTYFSISIRWLARARCIQLIHCDGEIEKAFVILSSHMILHG